MRETEEEMIERRSQNAEAAMGWLLDGLAFGFELVVIGIVAVLLLIYWLLS